jgi:bacterioferritin (cytochrome b1)
MASKDLIDGLNQALNREISTFLRYMLQAAQIKGAPWEAARTMYEAEVADEVEHAQYLAQAIVIHGGTPKLAPDLTPPPQQPEQMLRRDIEQEEVDVRHYMKLAGLAEREGLIELKLRMEEQAADEQRHAQHMQRLLG